jgi:hypothetical protein
MSNDRLHIYLLSKKHCGSECVGRVLNNQIYILIFDLAGSLARAAESVFKSTGKPVPGLIFS